MSSSTTLSAPKLTARAKKRKGLICRLARRGVLAKLQALRWGRVDIVEGEERYQFGSLCDQFPKVVVVRVNDGDFYGDVGFGGSVGAGESYMLGLWSCDDLVELMRIMQANPQVLDDLNRGMAWVRKPVHKLFHWLHRNTVKGSRENIQAHYDLGNDFFRLFLDDTMMYSSAYFESESVTLKEASVAKLDMICKKLNLGPDDRVLEIGTGWGGFALHAASHYGCHVTTTTISNAQYELAAERVAQAGLGDRITLLKEDFRELSGRFDKIVSIEMIEAVGEENIARFFAVCDRCLKPGGQVLIQAITIRDQLFDRYRKSVDFIQRFIFPGGFLPSMGFLSREMAATSSFSVRHVQDLGHHYALTLRRWRENFARNRRDIVRQGFSDDFLRLWEFYFCYCEAGFMQRSTGVIHMLLEKDLSPQQ